MAQGKRQTSAGRKPASKRSAAAKRSTSSADESVVERLRSFVERLREPQIAAAIGVVLAAAIIAFLVLNGGDDGGSESSDARGPEAVSADELRELPSSLGHPVYWAGERPGTQYELRVDEDGNVFIRYLGSDAEVVARNVPAFTVGTYPFSDAYGALQGLVSRPGAIRAKTPDGGLVVTNESNPESVYIAYPGSDYEIEVFDPDAAAALRAATSGRIEPIE